MRKFFLIIMAILMALIVSCGGEPNGIEPDASPDASPDVTTTQGEAIAIAKLREFDPNDPDAPYTDSNTIGPLDRVYFDGRDSHLTEPIFLGGGSVAQEEIGSFYWEVLEAPEGVSSLGYKVFEWDGKKTDLPSMKVPTVGHYVVRLTVAPTLAAGTTDLDS